MAFLTKSSIRISRSSKSNSYLLLPKGKKRERGDLWRNPGSQHPDTRRPQDLRESVDLTAREKIYWLYSLTRTANHHAMWSKDSKAGVRRVKSANMVWWSNDTTLIEWNFLFCWRELFDWMGVPVAHQRRCMNPTERLRHSKAQVGGCLWLRTSNRKEQNPEFFNTATSKKPKKKNTATSELVQVFPLSYSTFSGPLLMQSSSFIAMLLQCRCCRMGKYIGKPKRK